MKQWYEELFENYASRYDSEIFTQGTSGECDFIERGSITIRRLKFWMSAAAPGATR